MRRAALLCTGQLACLSPYAWRARRPRAPARAAHPRASAKFLDRRTPRSRLFLEIINTGKSNTRMSFAPTHPLLFAPTSTTRPVHSADFGDSCRLKMGCMLLARSKIRGEPRGGRGGQCTSSRAGDGSLVALSCLGCAPEVCCLPCGSAGSGGVRRRARRWSAPVLVGWRH